MPNKNYIKGRRKEYAIMKALKDNGYIIAHRTAGSHSPIDVFAIHKEKKQILFIQSKPDDYKGTNKLLKQWGWLNDEFLVKFIVR